MAAPQWLASGAGKVGDGGAVSDAEPVSKNVTYVAPQVAIHGRVSWINYDYPLVN